MAPLLNLDWRIRNFPKEKFCIGKFPQGEVAPLLELDWRWGFVRDSFDASLGCGSAPQKFDFHPHGTDPRGCAPAVTLLTLELILEKKSTPIR